MAKPKTKPRNGGKATARSRISEADTRRTRVASEDLPRRNLQDAEGIARILHDNFAGRAASWDDVASGLDLSPGSATTKYLIWSAQAYGLIKKGENGSFVLAETGRKIIAPTFDGEDLEGRRKAALTPSVLSKFFTEYQGYPIPDDQHFANVLETKFGVPRDRTAEARQIIIENGRYANLLRDEPNGKTVVQLMGGAVASATASPAATADGPSVEAHEIEADMARTCFYITPIGGDGTDVRRHSDMMLRHLVEPAASENGLQVIRADKIEKSGLITKQIMEYLVGAKLCVADLSFANPNAFYELGVRHAFGMAAIQIIRASEKIPFDVAQGRTIIVDTSDVYTVADRLESARRELAEHIKTALNDPAQSARDNPVSVYLPDLSVSVRRSKST